MLAALLVCAMAGCGGDGGIRLDPVSRVPEKGGLREKVRAASQVDTSFPAVEGKTLKQLAEEIKGGGSTEVGLATSVFTVGRQPARVRHDRRPGQFVYGPTAVYVAPTPDEPAEGPFVAPADVLVTEGRYRSRQAAEGERPVRGRLRRRSSSPEGPGLGGAGGHADRRHLRGGARAQVEVTSRSRTRSPTSARPRPRSRPTRWRRSRATRS